MAALDALKRNRNGILCCVVCAGDEQNFPRLSRCCFIFNDCFDTISHRKSVIYICCPDVSALLFSLIAFYFMSFCKWLIAAEPFQSLHKLYSFSWAQMKIEKNIRINKNKNQHMHMFFVCQLTKPFQWCLDEWRREEKLQRNKINWKNVWKWSV